MTTSSRLSRAAFRAISAISCPSIGVSSRQRVGPLRSFLMSESGEASPMSYLLALSLTLLFIFFALDLGLRKGAALATEYAAYCAARSAATYIPRDDKSGGCITRQEREAVQRAAAACLSSVERKGGLLRGAFGFEMPYVNPINELVDRTVGKVEVTLFGQGADAKRSENKKGDTDCFKHNEVITARVTYTYRSLFALSPLSWSGKGQLQMTAEAAHMIHTVK